MALIDVITALEIGDLGPWRNWVGQEKIDHFLQNGGALERHTILQVSCSLGCEKAVEFLIEKNADVNFCPPDGTPPLLLALQSGWEGCASLLISAKADINICSKDSSHYLGQSIPIYTTGGRSLLQIAAESAQINAVQLLLNILLQEERGMEKIHWKDNNGRDAWDLVSRKMVLAKTEAMRNDLKIVLELLFPYFPKSIVPDKETAERDNREDEKKTRERITLETQQSSIQKRNDGLKQIKLKYIPKYPEIYSERLPDDALTPEFKQALISGDYSKVITEPAPNYGVYVCRFLTEQFCAKILEEVENYEMVAQQEKLPLFYRHDGNLGSLEDCGFSSFFSALLASLKKIGETFFSDVFPIFCRHAFLTRNWVGRTEEFKKHKDKSDITLNICLKKEDGKGSTVSFYESIEGTVPPENHKTIFEYTHTVGFMVIHKGLLWHKTNPIQNGTRSSLIIWADSSHKILEKDLDKNIVY